MLQQQQSPDKVPRIRELTDDDVLLGRGFPAIENEGNVRFRELVRSRSAEYHTAYRRHTKDSIAREVVNTIHRRKGRFLTQLDSVPDVKGLVIPAGARVWIEADEGAVLVKAKQALRDHSDDSKEGKQFTRRRPAAGSGNIVLEWVTPRTSPSEQTGGSGNAAASTVAANAGSAPPTAAYTGTAMPSQSSHISNLLASQQMSFFNQELGSAGLGSLTVPGLQAYGGSNDSTAAFLAAATAAQQQQSMFGSTQLNPSGAGAYPQASLQVALQQILENQNQGQGNTVGGANTLGPFSSIFGNPPSSAFGSLPRPYETQPSRVTMSERALSASQGLSSSSNSLTSQLQGGPSTTQVGSRANTAMNRGIERASSAGVAGRQEPGEVVLCGLEVSMLKVLCSFGIPLWSKESRETAFESADQKEKGSLALTWMDVGKRLVSDIQVPAAVGNLLSTDLQALARIAIFLVRRCVECTQLPSPVAAAASPRPIGAETTNILSKGDGLSVQQVLTQWSLELGDCSAPDGSLVAGTILETLNAPNATAPEEEKRASPLSVPVAAVLSAKECKTIVETIATLVQLRWVFQHHPTTTVFSLLSAQDGDTSRDYLLLKGVLEHGLTNEVEFRIQGSNTTRNEVEDRICFLTKLLFKHLQELVKKDALSSLKRKYSALLGV